MADITFEPSPGWLDENRGGGEEVLAKRIATILSGADSLRICPPYKKENGHWQLDGSNDWWFWIDEETGECCLDYRYSGDHCAAALEGLQAFLEWRLGRVAKMCSERCTNEQNGS